jgi:hypothetical protein
VPRDAKTPAEQVLTGLARLIARAALREVLQAEAERAAAEAKTLPAVTPDIDGENKEGAAR